MDNNKTIKELNKLLKGQYMGIHSYENYLETTINPMLREELIDIQKIHREHADIIIERIHQLGGTAVNSTGIVGTITEFSMELSGYPTKSKDIIKGAIKGEHMGLSALEKFLTNETDPTTGEVVEKILSKDRSIVDRLKVLLQNNN
ncbi:MAG: Ferritin-like domain protein [Bacillales bacterium]|jgi:bacterioferritin|nr:Ferritin-like domain protein [Bacillales bacterium]